MDHIKNNLFIFYQQYNLIHYVIFLIMKIYLHFPIELILIILLMLFLLIIYYLLH